jgi:hypothetical protein
VNEVNPVKGQLINLSKPSRYFYRDRKNPVPDRNKVMVLIGEVTERL